MPASILLKYCFNHSQLFEADKQDDFDDVYEESRALTASSSSGRLATLWGGESPGDEFVVIDEKEEPITSLNDTR